MPCSPRIRLLAGLLVACGPSAPDGTTSSDPTRADSAASASSSEATSTPTTADTTGAPECAGPSELPASHPARQCLARTAADCETPLPNTNGDYCLWLEKGHAWRLPRCSTRCDAPEPVAVCVAMFNAPETGCNGPCWPYVLASGDDLYILDGDFCFEFPSGWDECHDQSVCQCCIPE